MSPSTLAAPAGFVLAHLCAALAFAAIACAFGWFLTARVPWAGRGERLAGATAVGMAALAQTLFVLGLAGWLRPLPVALTLLGALAVSYRSWPRLGSASRHGNRKDLLTLLVVAAALAAIAPLLLLFLYPPVDFDATMYHLPFARAFAATGSLPALPDLRFPVFPQLNELLFAGALLLWSDLGAQWTQALGGLLTALLLLFWEPGERPGPAGILAAACWLGTPMVVKLAGTAYVDLGTTLFFTLAALALSRWRVGGERAWLTLAAFASGCAASSKYTGLFAIASVVAIAWWDAARGRRLASAGWALLVSALTAAPWYLRIYLLTGNPVHPTFAELFGSDPTPLFGSASAMLEAKGGLGEALRSWVALPWTLVEQPAAVGWTWSKAYLLGLPLALWAAVREPWGRRVGLGILVYSLVFALLSFPDSRLLLPIAPLWCHLIGRGADRLLAVRARPRARLAAVAVAALLLLAPGSRKGWRDLAGRRLPPHDRAGREAYLRAHLPAYPALEHLNRTRGAQASVYAFFAENLAYYAEGRYQGDWFGPAGYGTVFPVLGEADALAGRLRELGADHLLLSRHGPYPRPPLPDGDPAVARRFELLFADAGARLYRIREGGTPEVER